MTTVKITPKRIFLVLSAVILVSLGLLHLRGEMILGMFTNLEQTFDGDEVSPQFSPPRWVPRVMVNQLDSYVDKHHGNDPRAFALKQRFYLLLGAPVPPVWLHGVKSIRPEFSDALRQLSNTTSVNVQFSPLSTKLTEEDATLVCEALRDMPRLTYIDLHGAQFSDSSIAHLAGHPKLEMLRLSANPITRASIPTFASMPSLKSVSLLGTIDTEQSEEIPAITKALSGKVTVSQR